MTSNEIFNNTRNEEDSDRFYFENDILYHDMETMPCDRFEDGKGFIYATGREWWDEIHQYWVTEYEDEV